MSSAYKPDNLAAKRLKTFSMKENIQPESVTAAVTNSHTESNPRSSLRNSTSSSSIPSSSRPNSHHRRRSSVSTRRESAEMMGLPTSTLSELPTQDDADTDSVRKHALWALEGKFNHDTYSKVQIPELDSADAEKKFELSLKNPFQLTNSLSGKRDSIGRVLTPSLSSKDQLHTLLEEEEEEEEENRNELVRQSSEFMPPQPQKSLSLRPLNLTPAVSAPIRNGLKPLTLATSPPLTSPTGPLSVIKANGSQVTVPTRRSSVSYKRPNDNTLNTSCMASNLLPTPELTPVTAERPLSPSEQAFLSSNQVSLLSRISELERVLAVRTRTMSIGTSSSRQLSISSASSDAPSDEMLCLVRDLKMERDDLMHDLGTWQTRVTDLESQITLLTQRVEKERCEVWQAKEKVQTLERDRTSLQRDLSSANFEIRNLESALATSREAEQQATISLEAERLLRQIAEREVENFAHIHSDRSRSVASSNSSMTDVDHDMSTVATPLKTVPEEDESFDQEDVDELAHYEDEGEDDVELYSDDSFSDNNTGALFLPVTQRVSSNVLSLPPNLTAPLPSPSSAASSTPPPTPLSFPVVHTRRSSLEQNWSFPKGAQPMVTRSQEVDRFFDCLEVVDGPAEPTSTAFDIRPGGARDKYGFFGDDEDLDNDDCPPFIIPASMSNMVLEMVPEEEELDSMLHLDLNDQSSVAFWTQQFLSRNSDIESDDERRDFPSSPSPQAMERSHLERFHITEEGTAGAFNTDCATPKPPTFMITPMTSPALQTPRKPLRSAIPRLSPSPPKKSTEPTFPPTPISNPRTKLIDSSRTALKGRELTQALPSTPSKIASVRDRSTVPIVSVPINTSTVKSTAITALASYLPWAGWVHSDTREPSEIAQRVQFKDCQGLNHNSTSKSSLRMDTKRSLAPAKKATMSTQMKKPERLFLL